MSHTVTIAGQPVELAWTQDTAKRYAFRSSQIGGGPSSAQFGNSRKAAAAVTTFLWLLLPPAVHADYPAPEDLFAAIDHETEAESIHAALVAIFADMAPTEEKKTSSKKSPSRKSS